MSVLWSFSNNYNLFTPIDLTVPYTLYRQYVDKAINSHNNKTRFLLYFDYFSTNVYQRFSFLVLKPKVNDMLYITISYFYLFYCVRYLNNIFKNMNVGECLAIS